VARPGAALSTQDLKVIPFFESLLAQDRSDEKIEARWGELAVDAMKFNSAAGTKHSGALTASSTRSRGSARRQATTW
jgi:hypothetical protein